MWIIYVGETIRDNHDKIYAFYVIYTSTAVVNAVCICILLSLQTNDIGILYYFNNIASVQTYYGFDMFSTERSISAQSSLSNRFSTCSSVSTSLWSDLK